MDSKLDIYTPKALKVGAAWSWRFLAIAGAVAVLWWLGSYLLWWLCRSSWPSWSQPG